MTGPAPSVVAAAGTSHRNRDSVSSRATKVTSAVSAAGIEAHLQARLISEFLDFLVVVKDWLLQTANTDFPHQTVYTPSWKGLGVKNVMKT